MVALAIATVNRLNISELWIEFGAGKSFQLITPHEIAKGLRPDQCVTLPMFHTLPGCDTVSCLGSTGQKTAWGTYEDATPAFSTLGAMPDSPAIDE